jgi:hypothetical protein
MPATAEPRRCFVFVLFTLCARQSSSYLYTYTYVSDWLLMSSFFSLSTQHGQGMSTTTTVLAASASASISTSIERLLPGPRNVVSHNTLSPHHDFPKSRRYQQESHGWCGRNRGDSCFSNDLLTSTSAARAPPPFLETQKLGFYDQKLQVG